MEFSWCKVTEGKDCKEAPELTPHTGIQPVLLSQEHYSFFPTSLVFCYRTQTQHLQQLKTQLWACHRNTARTELFQIHSASLLPADNCTCYRPDSVPAHILQGGGAALPQVLSTSCKPTMEADAESGFQMWAAQYCLPNPCNEQLCVFLWGTSTAGPTEEVIQNICYPHFGGGAESVWKPFTGVFLSNQNWNSI